MTDTRGDVIVRFDAKIKLPYDDFVSEDTTRARFSEWKDLVHRFPGIRLRRAIASISAAQIEALEESAERLDSKYESGGFLRTFRVVRPLAVNARALAEALDGSADVELAYVSGGPAKPPAIDPSTDPDYGAQDHHQPAQVGVASSVVWPSAGADGAGVKLAVIEQGLPAAGGEIPAYTAVGFSNVSEEDHAACALTLVAGPNNTTGGLGVAPNAGPIHVVSEYMTAADASGFDRESALFAAIAALGFGDVLLLESQTKICINWFVNTLGELQCQNEVNAPLEIEDVLFKAIRLATALGIIVIEPTGNGGRDLDAMVDVAGATVLAPASAAFRDSGAILVGACGLEALGRKRAGFSSYGSRVNCFARGENVTCTKASGATVNDFGGTSSASAIVAGAALALQGMAKALLHYRLGPLQMRSLLGDVGRNTHSGDESSYWIGVMPNLEAIASHLDLVPDIYARDQIGDIGDPTTGVAHRSPDIILVPVAVADEQAAYGESSGTADVETLSAPTVVAGSTPTVYVRVRNRGLAQATNAVARVYWSPPSSLVTPDAWTLIGVANLAVIPPAGVLTVFPPIGWVGGAPGPGHYCLVATIGCAEDPEPLRPATIDEFARFVRENNNVAWRNIDTVLAEPVAAPGPRQDRPRDGRGGPGDGRSRYRMSFDVASPAASGVRMRLEIVAKLPRGSRARVKLPIAFADAVVHRDPPLPRAKPGTNVVLPLDVGGATNVGEFSLGAGRRVTLDLEVVAASPARGQRHEVFARQMYQGREVGRMTFFLESPPERRRGAPPRGKTARKKPAVPKKRKGRRPR